MMVLDDTALDVLLDELASTSCREERRAVLRSIVERLIERREAEYAARRREVLGKLGGG